MYYIVKTNQYIAAFYHVRQRGLIRRNYQNGRWHEEQIISENSRENFTIHYERETLYVFCQDSSGNIVAVIISDADGTINRRVVLENQSVYSPVMVHPIISDKGLSIIYNAAGSGAGSNYLIMRRMGEEGQWTPAARIDKYWPGAFDIQRVAGDHLVLFYQTRTSDTNLGYREITPYRQGAYHTYYSTKYYLSDSSCLATNDGVHTLFVVKSMFSSQLFYRRNLTGSFDDPVALFEGQRIENCLLFFIKDHLYITFLSSGALFICASDDKGASFSRPARYRGRFCRSPVRAYFVSQTSQSEGRVFLRQVYVDRSSPWDIQIIPDMLEDFFPADTKPDGDRRHAPFDTEFAYREEIRRLKHQIELQRGSLNGKDAQIASLTRQLAEKDREPAGAARRFEEARTDTGVE